jgi:hypothetical protein
MPKPTTKTRQELRSLFLRNAIPTERDYADLIAAGLNQADDGVLKLADQSLGLVQQKPDVPLLRLYADPAAETSAWQAQLIGNKETPGFGLSGPAGSLALFLDGPSGHVGIGTGDASHRLTLKASGADGGVGGNKLTRRGNLAIRSNVPQIDFLDMDGNGKDWAIQVRNNKLSLICSPWEDKNLVLDGSGRVGIGTESPREKLEVAGRTRVESDLVVKGDVQVSGGLDGHIRKVWFRFGDPCVYWAGQGKLANRTLQVRKSRNDTVLRIVYSDNTRVYNERGPAAARWEIRESGKSFDPPIIMDRYEGGQQMYYIHTLLVGYAKLPANPKPANAYSIEVWVSPVPGESFLEGGVVTGWNGSNGANWCLEVEEIPSCEVNQSPSQLSQSGGSNQLP